MNAQKNVFMHIVLSYTRIPIQNFIIFCENFVNVYCNIFKSFKFKKQKMYIFSNVFLEYTFLSHCTKDMRDFENLYLYSAHCVSIGVFEFSG